MSAPLKIDFVSDVSCPWCAIGLVALEQALERLSGEISAEIHFQPFELNPQMEPQGQDIGEHLSQKYGMSADQLAASQETIRARGAAVGFTFDMDRRNRIYNTFEAHRLLHWAEAEAGVQAQRALKHALLQAYFEHGRNPGEHAVLLECATAAGLDRERARAVLESDQYAQETRAAARFWLEQGIHSVPAIVINQRYLIQGGQPVEVFEQSLRRIVQQQAD